MDDQTSNYNGDKNRKSDIKSKIVSIRHANVHII